MTQMATATATEMLLTKIPVDEHGKDILTTELNQLSFKDRNDYHGKWWSSVIKYTTVSSLSYWTCIIHT